MDKSTGSNSNNPPPQQQSGGGSAAIMARLDAYLPTLNTGLMDVRVQDAILNYPLVRSLLVPECDLEARRRCINLITKVLNAATPVLPLILQEQSNLQPGSTQSNDTKPPIPVLSHDAQSKVMSIISTMAERDRLIRFWMNHHLHNKGKTTTTKPDSNGVTQTVHPTIAIYTKIKESKEILSDLADRVQGAICIVFWECWDEVYPMLAEIVGGDEMQQADTGRIFRPSGEAAMYINRLKVEKKQKAERERRESIMSSAASPPNLQPQQQNQQHQHSQQPQQQSSQQFWDNLLETNGITPPTIANSNSGDSPASLITDTSQSSYQSTTYTNWLGNNNNNSNNSNPGPVAFQTQTVHSDQQDLPLFDSNDMDTIMTEFDGEIDAFTNIGDGKPQQPPMQKPLDLRKRIQMMEEGLVHDDDEAINHSGIVW